MGWKKQHGESRPPTPEFTAWTNMKARCNPNSPDRLYYGDRGIKVCKRWMKYENFLIDMGRKPGKKFSLDRIYNSGNYTPTNCRWATPSMQMKNRRRWKWSTAARVEFNRRNHYGLFTHR